jgi:hypothetical protein
MWRQAAIAARSRSNVMMEACAESAAAIKTSAKLNENEGLTKMKA